MWFPLNNIQWIAMNSQCIPDWIYMYHKTSSRGAYWHDPFWSVFEEYPLDSTRSDTTMTLSIKGNINSAVVISVVVESSWCSSKTLQKGSCPYALLDEALRYVTIAHFKLPQWHYDIWVEAVQWLQTFFYVITEQIEPYFTWSYVGVSA